MAGTAICEVAVARRVAGTFDYLRFRAFAHATEVPERVQQALRHAAQSEKVQLEEETLEGSHGNPIVAYQADVRGNPTIRATFLRIANDDPEGFARLREEVPRRLDEHMSFYFRLDKQEAAQGRSVLTTSDDAIMVRARLYSFTAKRNGPLQEVLAFLEEIQRKQSS